jgi:hypothetical protein
MHERIIYGPSPASHRLIHIRVINDDDAGHDNTILALYGAVGLPTLQRTSFSIIPLSPTTAPNTVFRVSFSNVSSRLHSKMITLPDEELTPLDAPTLNDAALGAFTHNARLLTELAKKDSLGAHVLSLEELTSNGVVNLLTAQKKRRCRQIYDERNGLVSCSFLLARFRR